MLWILHQVANKKLVVCYKHITHIYRYYEFCHDICIREKRNRVLIKKHIIMRKQTNLYGFTKSDLCIKSLDKCTKDMKNRVQDLTDWCNMLEMSHGYTFTLENVYLLLEDADIYISLDNEKAALNCLAEAETLLDNYDINQPTF